MIDPNAVLEIEDPRVLEAFRNPMRVRLLRLLKDPLSVKELAALLEVPTTRLYHHVNLLLDVGVIEPVETRKVGAMIEKVYQRNAGNFRPGLRLLDQGLDPLELASLGVSVVLDPARLDAESALSAHFAKLRAGADGGIPTGDLAREVVSLAPDKIEVVRERIAELLTFIAQLDTRNEGTEYAFTFAFFPVAGGGERA